MKKNYCIIAILCISTCSIVAQTHELAGTNIPFMATAGSSTEEEIKNSEASFPGGLEALRTYLADHFQYSDKAVENGIEGTLIVKFWVGKDGKPLHPEVKQSLHPIVDAEAIRVVNSMPDWQPRVKNGQAVTTSVEIPFEVRLR